MKLLEWVKTKNWSFFAPGWVLLAVGYFYLCVIQTDPINVIPHREVAVVWILFAIRLFNTQLMPPVNDWMNEMKCSNKEVLGPGVCFSFLAQLCVNHRLWNSYLLSSLAGFLEWTSGNRHVVFLSLALYCAALLCQREILCHKTNTPLLNSANASDHNSLSIFLSFLPSFLVYLLPFSVRSLLHGNHSL